MGNFFLDNQDIQFLFEHLDLNELAGLQELHAENGDADYAPSDAADTIDNYHRTLAIVGAVSADTIAPNAEQVDREGNTLNEDGTVRYGVMVANNSGTKAESNKDKRVYGQLELYPTDNLVFTVGGDYASLSDEVEENAVNGNILAGYRGDGFAAGAEGFFNRITMMGDLGEDEMYGVSLFARSNVNNNVTVIGRFDRVEMTAPGVEASENYFLIGVALRPHKNVEFIPNVWGSKVDGDDNAFVSGRLTAHFKF